MGRAVSIWERKSKVKSSAQWFQYAEKQFPDGMEKFRITWYHDDCIDQKNLLQDIFLETEAEFGCLLINFHGDWLADKASRQSLASHWNLPIPLSYSRKMRGLGPYSIMTTRYFEPFFGKEVGSLPKNDVYAMIGMGANPLRQVLQIDLAEDIAQIAENADAYDVLRRQVIAELGADRFETFDGEDQIVTAEQFAGSIVGILPETGKTIFSLSVKKK
jgi:hypothetical protein